MSHEPLTALSDLEYEEDPASTFLSDRHHRAIEQLHAAYTSDRPLAIMIGDGPAAAAAVISGFLGRLPAGATAIRVDEHCDSATSFMGRVIRSVGFDPKDMRLEDLDGIFKMFLAFQKNHERRTVIAVERIQEEGLWVADKIRELVEQERENPCGLMILVSGQEGLRDLADNGPLDEVSVFAGKRIVLAPFTLAESKQYIRQRLLTAGKAGIDQLFQYRAINRIHELSGGVPDEVGALVNRCLEVAAAEGVELVTAELVQRAFDNGRVADIGAETVNMRGFRPRKGRLVYQISGREMLEMALRQGHTLIGRSTLCDVHIDSSTVSRRHALISYTASGAILVDLNSTNGTFVDGRRIRRHELQPGETIEIGGTSIEYIVEPEELDDVAGRREPRAPLFPGS